MPHLAIPREDTSERANCYTGSIRVHTDQVTYDLKVVCSQNLNLTTPLYMQARLNCKFCVVDNMPYAGVEVVIHSRWLRFHIMNTGAYFESLIGEGSMDAISFTCSCLGMSYCDLFASVPQ